MPAERGLELQAGQPRVRSRPSARPWSSSRRICGCCSLRPGRTRGRRMLVIRPADARARLELARSFFQKGEDTLARG